MQDYNNTGGNEQSQENSTYGNTGGPQGTNSYENNGNTQGGAPYEDPYNGTPYGGAPYEGGPYNGASYNSNNNGNGPYGNGNYGGPPYGGNPYNQQNMNGNNPYGGYYHPNNGPQYGNGGTWAGGSPLVKAIQQAGRSVPFLIGTIGYTVYLVLTFFSMFTSEYGYTLYGNVLGSMGTGAGILLGMIPAAIFIISMWMVYLGCARDELPSAGITLSRGAIITMIVFMGIATGMFLLVVLIFLKSSGYSQAYGRSYMTSSFFSLTMGVIVVILILVFAFLILSIIYYVKLLKTTKIIRNTINTGVYCGKLPMYPLVINFLLAALNLFSLFSTLGSAGVLYKIITLLAGLAYVASMIATTVSLIMLRTQLESMK